MLVDPVAGGDWLVQFQGSLRNAAQVELARDFLSARRLLFDLCPNLVVANIRLAAYNGIHLAMMARLSHTRCIVYAHEDVHDIVLARQAQTAGAFYARQSQVPSIIGRFLSAAALPDADRRDPAILDRRATRRAGRRVTDSPVTQTLGSRL